jgi:DNA-binding LacI/PurR family transcriptional regulator
LASVYVNNLSPRNGNSPENLDQRARQYAGFLIEWLRGPDAADAILVATDADLYPVARACRLCGREPGRDVLLAGYDNFWEACWEREHEPLVPAATVDKDNHACGVALVDLLLERIAGRLPAEPQRRWIVPQLVVPERGGATAMR